MKKKSDKLEAIHNREEELKMKLVPFPMGHQSVVDCIPNSKSPD